MRAILLAGIAGLMTAGTVAATAQNLAPYWEDTETYMQRQLHGYPRAYVLNQWGGIVSCDFRHNAYVTHRMRRYCAGDDIPAADPRHFDCSSAETDSEYRYCGRRPGDRGNRHAHDIAGGRLRHPDGHSHPLPGGSPGMVPGG